MSRLIVFGLFSFFTSCFWNNNNNASTAESSDQPDSLKIISDVLLPSGYKRIDQPKGCFGEWLRNISLKKDKHVYLYNGQLKRNQNAQFAVLDVSVGKKDLQQCADAVMRLRAEYLFAQKKYSEIEFKDNAGRSYKWAGGFDRTGFERYLETVFGMCGSASLEKQLKPVNSLSGMQPGDIFIKGGFPGHAMMVIDMAVNDKGNKIFMLAQSYMPAQDIHIVKNPMNETLSPWYEINDREEIITPEWIFKRDQLKKW